MLNSQTYHNNETDKCTNSKKTNSSRLGFDSWNRFNCLSPKQKYLFNNPPKAGTLEYKEYLNIYDIVVD